MCVCMRAHARARACVCVFVCVCVCKLANKIESERFPLNRPLVVAL